LTLFACPWRTLKRAANVLFCTLSGPERTKGVRRKQNAVCNVERTLRQNHEALAVGDECFIARACFN
jgi:hypothetical protein